MGICVLTQKHPTEKIQISIGHTRTKTLAHKQIGKLKQKEKKFPLQHSYVLNFFTTLPKPHIVSSAYRNSDYRLYGSHYEFAELLLDNM